MSFCVYSLGSIYKDWGIVRRYDILVNNNQMIIGGNDKDYNTIKKCKYFIPYKSKKIFGSDGFIFENIYEIIGEPIKINTIEKWGETFINENNYYDNIIGKPKECINKVKSMLNEGRYDILWNVKKIKNFTIKRNKLSSININSKLSKISNNNPNFIQLYNLIN